MSKYVTIEYNKPYKSPFKYLDITLLFYILIFVIKILIFTWVIIKQDTQLEEMETQINILRKQNYEILYKQQMKDGK